MKESYIIIWKDSTGRVYRNVFKYGNKMAAIFHFSDISIRLPFMKRMPREVDGMIIFETKYIPVPPSREVLYIFTVKPKHITEIPAY